MGPDPGRLLTMVGVNSAAIGGAVVAAPHLAAHLLDAAGRTGAIRAAGLAELALAPALVWGRPRWAWASARAVVTLAFAAATADHARRERSERAAIATAGMVVLASTDSVIAARLRQPGR